MSPRRRSPAIVTHGNTWTQWSYSAREEDKRHRAIALKWEEHHNHEYETFFQKGFIAYSKNTSKEAPPPYASPIGNSQTDTCKIAGFALSKMSRVCSDRSWRIVKPNDYPLSQLRMATALSRSDYSGNRRIENLSIAHHSIRIRIWLVTNPCCLVKEVLLKRQQPNQRHMNDVPSTVDPLHFPASRQFQLTHDSQGNPHNPTWSDGPSLQALVHVQLCSHKVVVFLWVSNPFIRPFLTNQVPSLLPNGGNWCVHKRHVISSCRSDHIRRPIQKQTSTLH